MSVRVLRTHALIVGHHLCRRHQLGEQRQHKCKFVVSVTARHLLDGPQLIPLAVSSVCEGVC
jgi:hypothetical protein